MSDRFWAKVNIGDYCWKWTGAKNTCGYGWVFWKGKSTGAHRVSWELTNGKIPKGSSVLHKCDNPPCVNPKHLYLGSQRENMQDRADRRRGNTQKLSVDDVSKIRQLRKDGLTLKEIADRFHISNGHASVVSRGLCYGRE